jgi:hypothetical protein
MGCAVQLENKSKGYIFKVLYKPELGDYTTPKLKDAEKKTLAKIYAGEDPAKAVIPLFISKAQFEEVLKINPNACSPRNPNYVAPVPAPVASAPAPAAASARSERYISDSDSDSDNGSPPPYRGAKSRDSDSDSSSDSRSRKMSHKSNSSDSESDSDDDLPKKFRK